MVNKKIEKQLGLNCFKRWSLFQLSLGQDWLSSSPCLDIIFKNYLRTITFLGIKSRKNITLFRDREQNSGKGWEAEVMLSFQSEYEEPALPLCAWQTFETNKPHSLRHRNWRQQCKLLSWEKKEESTEETPNPVRGHVYHQCQTPPLEHSQSLKRLKVFLSDLENVKQWGQWGQVDRQEP